MSSYQGPFILMAIGTSLIILGSLISSENDKQVVVCTTPECACIYNNSTPETQLDCINKLKESK